MTLQEWIDEHPTSTFPRLSGGPLRIRRIRHIVDVSALTYDEAIEELKKAHALMTRKGCGFGWWMIPVSVCRGVAFYV